MEENKSLVKSAETRLPKFVEDAYESVEKMERFAEILLNSKLVPFHFFEKLPDGKPDFTKGKVPAVVAVLIQGYQLQLPPLTALQHIIPVNGLLSIKGDLAKSMIFNSGKLKPGSWVEEETGSIEAGDYMVKITATRSDNGQTLSRSFSVAQAKRAGLWITEQQVGGSDGWKYKSSAWWKYPSRMCNYRALGFIARDMFPDVMAGIYTTEEAMDIPKDVAEVIDTPDGNKIIIPDKEHSRKRSEKMTDRVADKIPDNKFGKVGNENVQDAEIVTREAEGKKIIENIPAKEEGEDDKSFITRYNKYISLYSEKYPELHLILLKEDNETPFTPDKQSTEYMNGVLVIRDAQTNEITNMAEIEEAGKEGNEAPKGRWTLKDLEAMETPILLQIVNDDMDMREACEIIGGKNTNKKLRELIFAHQEGKLDLHVAPYLSDDQGKDQKGQESVTPSGEADVAKGEIPVNKGFDKTPDKSPDLFLSKDPIKKEGTKVDAGNKYHIEIPAETPRDFSVVKALFNKLMGIEPQITTPAYMTLASRNKLFTKYPDKEMFLKMASVDEINTLLNDN